MKLANEKRKDGKILSAWSLDEKIFIKTSPSGRLRQMCSIEDIKELWRFVFCLFVYFVFLPSCYRLSFLNRAASTGGAYMSSFFLCAVTVCWSWCLAKCLVFPCFSSLALPWCEIDFSYMQIQIRCLLVWTKTKLIDAQTLTHAWLCVV